MSQPGSQVTLRTIVTLAFAILVTLALAFFLIRTREALTLTLGAAMIAVALDHLAAALCRRGLSRRWAMGWVVGGLLVVGAVLGVLMVPAVVTQARALAAQAPSLWQRLIHTPALEALGARAGIQQSLQDSVSAATGAVSPLFNAIAGLLGLVGDAVSLLFLAIFMLIFGGDVLLTGLSMVPLAHRSRAERVLDKIYASVGGYLGGLLAICTANGTVTMIFLAIIRMPFFLPLGILSGLSSLIPYAGPVVVGSVTSALVFITAGPWKALATLIYFLLYGQLEGNILGPLIFRRAVHVNPLVTLLAILFLADFMGAPGGVIAVPMAAVVQIIGRELLRVRREQVDEPIVAPTPAPTT